MLDLYGQFCYGELGDCTFFVLVGTVMVHVGWEGGGVTSLDEYEESDGREIDFFLC